jgi:hypothetical protein
MRIRGLALLVVLSLMLGLAACGGDKNDGVASAGGNGNGNSGGTGNSTASAEDIQQAQLKYAQCMRENGVDVPDPKPGEPIRIAGKGTDSKLQAAQEKCQHFIDEVTPEGGSINPRALDALLKYAKCMREHGADMPDPKTGRDLVLNPPKGSAAVVEAAQKACQSLLPGEFQDEATAGTGQ